MSQGTGLFREEALAALSAQEDFNVRARILGPGRWMWVIAMIIVVAGFTVWSLFGTMTLTASGPSVLTPEGGLTNIVGPADGVLITSLPASHQPVRAGATLGQVRSYTGAVVPITSVVNGSMVQVVANIGDSVSEGSPLALVWEDGKPAVFETFVPLSRAKTLNAGDRAVISPATVNERTYGGIVGEVMDVGQVAIDNVGIQSLVGSEALTEQIAELGPVVAVAVRPHAANTPTGFEWTSSNGPREPISIGTPATVSIEVSRESLVSLLRNNQ